MTATDESLSAHRALPGQPAPDLTVPCLMHGSYSLAEHHPRAFTMVVFFRGLHCPVCHAQLSEINRRIDDLNELGIEVVAVSGESRYRTEQLASEWKLDRLTLAYGLTEEQMRTWGLFVSRGRADFEPALFNEPGLFLIKPDNTVYYEALLSMPVGRPRLEELITGIRWWNEKNYPARGGD